MGSRCFSLLSKVLSTSWTCHKCCVDAALVPWGKCWAYSSATHQQMSTNPKGSQGYQCHVGRGCIRDGRWHLDTFCESSWQQATVRSLPTFARDCLKPNKHVFPKPLHNIPWQLQEVQVFQSRAWILRIVPADARARFSLAAKTGPLVPSARGRTRLPRDWLSRVHSHSLRLRSSNLGLCGEKVSLLLDTRAQLGINHNQV